MSISLRRYIHWKNEVPIEPTSTLVLTTPANTFVDIRVRTRPAHAAPLPDTVDLNGHAALLPCGDGDGGAASNRRSGDVPPELEWAFGGTTVRQPISASASTSTSTLEDITADSNADIAAHADAAIVTWRHTIDSHTRDAPSVVDTAVCAPARVDHAHHGVLAGAREVGAMMHPRRGVRVAYEEGWVDLPAHADGDVALSLRASAPAGQDGIVVRVGGYVQGVLRQPARHDEEADGAFACERWCRRPADGAGVQRWTCVFRAGPADAGLACAAAMRMCVDDAGAARALRVGDEVRAQGVVWTVDEVAGALDRLRAEAHAGWAEVQGMRRAEG